MTWQLAVGALVLGGGLCVALTDPLRFGAVDVRLAAGAAPFGCSLAAPQQRSLAADGERALALTARILGQLSGDALFDARDDDVVEVRRSGRNDGN